ncbi:sugar phosphate nucleotidyltransferase [Mangrovicoccus algicola]|uniref:NTP transferase domain-containing protein n=1 Tax=Mangrovicoccus algicola TaxID=2771008 RepID=A0A8J6YSW0_9RHOB|nr:sugar phosphate nucleotidyltransferase [Mangrovicoccus algicola]MBE3636817.1 NTP transferase domain-containing protein [Mangrovicoccus algicola]
MADATRAATCAGTDIAADEVFTVLLAGGRGSRLHELTDETCKPAVPFGAGRIVDYVLSSVAETGLERLLVATQYRPEALRAHLQGPWARAFADLRLREGPGVTGDPEGYRGTADAVLANLAEIDAAAPRDVVVLAADHVCRMDLGAMLMRHRAAGCAATVAATRVPLSQGQAFGILRSDAVGRVTAFAEKPRRPAPIPGDPGRALASMGIYVFRWDWLRAALAEEAARPGTRHDFGHDLLPRALAEGELAIHDLPAGRDGRPAYWRDVGSLDAYRLAQLDLRAGRVPRGLMTPPAAPWSHALAGSRDSVILPGATVPTSCRLTRCIVAPGASLPPGLVAGEDRDEDARWFRVTPEGTVLITAGMLARRAEELPRTARIETAAPADPATPALAADWLGRRAPRAMEA